MFSCERLSLSPSFANPFKKMFTSQNKNNIAAIFDILAVTFNILHI